MSERLIVDFRIAAAERDSYFTPEWSWPVSQSSYDEPLDRFAHYLYQLHDQLDHANRLKTAFTLVEADLTKELVSIAGTWIDVSTTQQQGFELIHHPDQTLYTMLKEDRFNLHSVVSGIYAARYGTFRSKIGRRLRRIAQWTGVKRINSSALSISGNPLTKQISPDSVVDFRIDPDQLQSSRSKVEVDQQPVQDLAIDITEKLYECLTSVGVPFTKNGSQFVRNVVTAQLTRGMADQDFKLPVSKLDSSSQLFTGTGGIYRSRLASYLAQREGATVWRTTHGGDTALFNDPFWPSIELPYATNYVMFGASAANDATELIKSHPRAQLVAPPPSVRAAGSDFHKNIVEQSQPSSSLTEGGNVAVISASFTGERRAIPHVKIHDVVYLEWHSRLLRSIRSFGYNTLAKRHPKGINPDISLFANDCDEELIQTGMAQLTNVDAYVLDICGSAFIEAMCSMKPVIVIDIPTRRMTENGRARISESAQIVKAMFDDRNRVIVDESELRHALEAPFDLDARKKFLDDYLLSSSQSG